MRVDPAVEKYLRRSYEQNLRVYKSKRIMRQLLTQLHPNIQFQMITRPESFLPPSSWPSPPSGSQLPAHLGSQPSPNEGDDAANDAANLRD